MKSQKSTPFSNTTACVYIYIYTSSYIPIIFVFSLSLSLSLSLPLSFATWVFSGPLESLWYVFRFMSREQGNHSQHPPSLLAGPWSPAAGDFNGQGPVEGSLFRPSSTSLIPPPTPVLASKWAYSQDHNYSGSRKMFPGNYFWKLTDLLQGRPCLELMIVSSNFPALLFLQDKLMESVWKPWIPVKKVLNNWTAPFPELIQ